MRIWITVLCCVFLAGCQEEVSSQSVSEYIPEGSTVSIEVAGSNYKVVEPEIVGEETAPNPSVVYLRASLGPTCSSSTAFFVKHRGETFLVTSKHSVIDSNTLSITWGSSKKIPFTVVKNGFSDVDIAAFLIKTKNPVPCLLLESLSVVQSVPRNDIVTGIPETWEPIECNIYGYPGGRSFRTVHGKLTHRADFVTSSYFISSAKSVSGMSGGPWVSCKTGRVLAVHTSSIGEEGNSRAGGVSVEELYKLLDSLIGVGCSSDMSVD